MLSDRCPVLSVLSVLSVTFMHCGQTVGWIKMKLGMQVGLGPGHIVLDPNPAPPPPKGHSPPNFRPISVAAKWLMSSWFNDLTLSVCVASRRWAGCEYNHMYVKCPTSSSCIHLTHFCDGVNDCGDNSDEPPTCGLFTVLLIHRVTVT